MGNRRVRGRMSQPDESVSRRLHHLLYNAFANATLHSLTGWTPMTELAEIYAYCPACGAKREQYEPVRPFRCHACGHTTFFGPVSAVGGIVTNDEGKVLLLRRANDPGRGKLGMPGGFVDHGESAEAALRREMLEEVGLTIRSMRYLVSGANSYKYRGVTIPVLDLFYVADVESGDIRTEDGEVSSWQWTELNDTVLDQMAFESNRRALEHYRNAFSKDA